MERLVNNHMLYEVDWLEEKPKDATYKIHNIDKLYKIYNRHIKPKGLSDYEIYLLEKMDKLPEREYTVYKYIDCNKIIGYISEMKLLFKLISNLVKVRNRWIG